MRPTGEKQYPFGGGGFSRIYMSHNTDISNSLCHCFIHYFGFSAPGVFPAGHLLSQQYPLSDVPNGP
jgi:hypothetical protein